MASDKQKSAGKKLLKYILILAIVGVAFGTISSAMKSRTASTASPSTAVPSSSLPSAPDLSPAPTISPTVPLTTSSSLAPTSTASGVTSSQSAVAFAATAVNLLSELQLQTPEQVQQIVSNLVVPEQQASLETTLESTGNNLVQWLGYSNKNIAASQAAYSVQTLQYRLEPPSANTATVTLFTVTHWISSDNLEYQVPSLTIVQLRQSGQGWLYVSSSDPAANQQPAAQSNLSYDETVARFQPFLKGFKDYVSTP